MSIAQIGAYILFALCLSTIAVVSYVKRQDIWQSFKGEDKVLQSNEFILFVCTVSLFFTIMGDLFFNLELSPSGWASIDFVIMSAFGVKVFHDKFKVE